jgi:GntR family transcriptional regulator
MISFRLNPKTGVPIYRQIQDQIRYSILAGQLSPGDQLPTIRALAVELKVNPNTVIRAYSELERAGVLTTEQGTGTFVASQPLQPLADGERLAKLEHLCTEFLAQAARYGFSAPEVFDAVAQLTRGQPS